MSTIKVIEHLTIYDNPISNLVSRHAFFPGLAKLPSGELLALFPIGEAFESAMNMFVSRSRDNGQTWTLEGPAYKDFNLGTGGFKPTVLKDGTLIALGYGFKRDNPEILVNPETGGLPDGANYISFSNDDGHIWSKPETMPLNYPEILEISGPCIELHNGNLFATGAPFPMWDGTIPSGRQGIAIRSRDKGKTWEEQSVFYKLSDGKINAYETRSCQMPDGRIVVMIWCLDEVSGKNLTNHVVVSHDNGITWSHPIDTGVPGQASNVISLKDNLLLSVHCHREGKVGLYVNIVDFTNDEWRVLATEKIWGNAPSKHVGGLLDMGKGLKFGQPSLLPIDNGEFLAAHWAIEDGQGRILAHRIRINFSDF